MNIEKNKDGFMIFLTLIWVAITVCGWTGKWFIGLNLSVLLMLGYMMIGSAKKGKLSKKLLFYPLISWAVVWCIGFYYSQHYALMFNGVAPTFTILGFHPSFAFTILTYWIGGVLTLTLGFYYLSDEWLSQKDWDEFKAKIAKIDASAEFNPEVERVETAKEGA